MSRDSTKEDLQDYFNLAQIVRLIGERGTEVYLKEFLRHEININYQVPTTPSSNPQVPNYSGYTALHFAFLGNRLSEKIRLLLDSGADVTVKNGMGMTVMHCIYHEDNSLGWEIIQEYTSETLDMLFDAQLASGNALNPRDVVGLSHFHIASATRNTRAVEFFLAHGVDVDQQVNMNAKTIGGHGPLHFAVRLNALDVAKVLLRHGANMKLKDADGLNPLQLCMMQYVNNAATVCKGRYEEYEINDFEAGKQMMKLLIESCAERRCFVVDDFGLSTFHLACALGDTNLIESHLKCVEDLNCTVGIDAPIFPGYTALHFAATSNIESVIYLLEKGADIAAKDASGVNPFDICLRKYPIEDICSILKNQKVLREVLLSDDKTKLVDLISAMRDLKNFRRLLKNIDVKNVTVPKHCQLLPGYTILHVAVALTKSAWKLRTDWRGEILENPHVKDESGVKCIRGEDEGEATGDQMKVVKECLQLGAEVTAQDAHGATPLHLAFQFAKLDVVGLLLRYHPGSVNPVDIKHNLSHLHIACAMRNATLVEKLISSGADIEARVSSTIKWYRPPKKQSDYFKKFFVFAGSTSLHVAVASKSKPIVKLLLKHAADLNAADAHGATPIHRCIGKRKRIGKILLASRRLEDRVVEEVGLSHLHVACQLNDADAIERLLDRGADVNATVSEFRSTGHTRPVDYFYGDPYALEKPYEFLRYFSLCKPLHLLILQRNLDTARLLVERGSEFLSTKAKTPTRFGYEFRTLGNGPETAQTQFALEALKSSNTLRERTREEVGMTMLHVACRVRDVDLVGDCLDAGVDVNARIREDSSVFAGCTALHVLMQTRRLGEHGGVGDRIFRLLMDSGADVAIVDANGETPMHACDRKYRTCPWRNEMFERYNDFGNNVIDGDGMSLLHLACIEKNAVAVEQFLRHGVDVNQTVDCLSELGGYTPLHATARWAVRSFEVVDLLLKYGANVNAKDREGDTPLHAAASSKGSGRQGFFKKLVDAGADVNVKNVRFRTPFEVLLDSSSVTTDEINFFLERGFRINVSNPLTRISVVAQIIEGHYDLPESLFQTLVRASMANELDDMGRSVLHNIVSARPVSSMNFLNRFIDQGCDIDCQDSRGKTPLHLAVDSENVTAINVLLSAGADINILDANKKTAYAYALDSYKREYQRSHQIPLLFGLHTLKLQLTGLFVRELNNQLQNMFQNEPPWKSVKCTDMKNIVEKAKDLKVSLSSVTVADILSETGVVAAYPTLLPHERDFLNDFFVNVDGNPMLEQCAEIKCLIKQQHRQALKRMCIFKAAKESLTILFQFWLPDNCCGAMLRYLTNRELEICIASVKEINCQVESTSY